MNVQFDSLIQSDLQVSTISDSTSTYNLTAQITVAGDRVNNFANGQVMRGDVPVATFSLWSTKSPSVNFNEVEYSEQCLILNEIHSFIINTNELVKTQPIHW